MQRITGQKDEIIKLLRELTVEDGRRRNSLFFAEGDELTRRAFDFGGRVHSLIVTERFAATADGEKLIALSESLSVVAYCTTEGLLSKILDAKPTPECLAIVERRVASLSEAISGDLPLVQMVEHGENADNLGMLLRSTDAAGATGVVLAADTVDPFGRRVVRGSRGAVFTRPICLAQDSSRVIDEAKKRGIQVIATSANSSTAYTNIDFTRPTMIVVGNEHVGISQTVADAADQVVRIPMLGKINSLNIAVAASMVLYEAVRQRSQ